MKIDLTQIDTKNFNVKPFELAGETVYLVTPNEMKCEWTQDNLIFRSSVWNSEGELISASYPKFFNFDEKPELAYTPKSLVEHGGVEALMKLDGSTLIISKYKGHYIVRTRGTLDASDMIKNGHEIEILKKKYPMAFDFELDTANVSLICEWVSPLNKIVIHYPEADIYLTGIVNHRDYSLASQNIVDRYARIIGVKRPERYNFTSVNEMILAVQSFRGVEGVCVYCNYGQTIRKLKGAEYLIKHRLKDEFGSLDKLIEYYFSQGKPIFIDFYQSIHDLVDYETAESCRPDINKIIDGMLKVYETIGEMTNYIEECRKLPTRKDIAMKILSERKDSSGFIFTLLDKGKFNDEQLKKLLYKILENT